MDKKVIPHYFVRQKIKVKNLVRYHDGNEIILNKTGIIKEIKDFGDDIGYLVEFDIELTYRSPYGSTWVEKQNAWTIFHNKDNQNIVKVR